MSAPAEFGDIDNSRLAGLVFELASQLHVERSRRLALEAALLRLGVLDAAQIEAAAEDPSYRQQTSRLADEAIRRLLQVLSESPDERKPLRAQAQGGAPPPQVAQGASKNRAFARDCDGPGRSPDPALHTKEK